MPHVTNHKPLRPDIGCSRRLPGTGNVRPKHSLATANETLALTERIERELALAAAIVIEHGPVYVPYLDRLERELDLARKTDPTLRARRILETYTQDDGSNAIGKGQSDLCSKDGSDAVTRQQSGVADQAGDDHLVGTGARKQDQLAVGVPRLCEFSAGIWSLLALYTKNEIRV